MIKDIIIINNFYGFCSFLLYNHTLNNINSISLLLFWCEIVCYKTQIIVYFFLGTVRMPLFVREIWRHSHYISPNFGCVLLIVLRFFGWSPNLILLSIRYILYPLALERTFQFHASSFITKQKNKFVFQKALIRTFHTSFLTTQ